MRCSRRIAGSRCSRNCPLNTTSSGLHTRNLNTATHTGFNPAGDAGDTSPNILVGGTSAGIPPQYCYVLSDIADQYWLPSVRSASSRFHSAIIKTPPIRFSQAGGQSPFGGSSPTTLNSRWRQRLAATEDAVNKKLSYRRGTARCVVPVEILPTVAQQCRNYWYDKS